MSPRLGAKKIAWEHGLHGSCVHCVTVDPARATAPLEIFLDLLKTQNERWLWHNSHEWVPPSVLDQTSPKGPRGPHVLSWGRGGQNTQAFRANRGAPAGGCLLEKNVDSRGPTHHFLYHCTASPQPIKLVLGALEWPCQGEVDGVIRAICGPI